MKILLLTQVLPYPPDSGPKAKTWNVLRYLARTHEVTLVSFTRGDQSDDVRRLKSHCRSVETVPLVRRRAADAVALARSVAGGEPWMMARDRRAAMARLVTRLAAAERFDVVHADQLNMCQYARLVPGAFRLFDAHNALWLLYRRLAETMPHGPTRWLLARDARLLRRYEGAVCRSFDTVTAVSESDRAALVEASGGAVAIDVVPIGVDVEALAPLARRPDADRVAFVGTMYWPPNADAVWWFARDIWPLVRTRRPGAAFDVIGARPPAPVRALADAGTGITVTGYAADLDAQLGRSAAMVVPVRAGGGMRVKILHALAQGLPVVSTLLGCEGIAAVNGGDLLIADTPRDFADAVVRLLDDPALAASLAQNGRRLVETRYDYRIACRPLDDVYARAARRPGGREGVA